MRGVEGEIRISMPAGQPYVSLSYPVSLLLLDPHDSRHSVAILPS